MAYFTFGSTKSSDKHIETLTDIIRPVQAGSRDSLVAVPGRPGVHYFGADLTEALIRVRGYSKASTMAGRIEIIRDLQEWLVGDELQQLIFSDEEDKFYMAKLMGEATPSIRGLLLFWDLTFLVPDACAYAVTPKTVTFPLEPGVKAANAGSASCPCVITAAMGDDASYLKITLAETGEFIRIERSFSGSDEIYIDTGQRFVSVNGADARADVTYLSTYFSLPPGDFTLAALPDIPLTVTFRERWA